MSFHSLVAASTHPDGAVQLKLGPLTPEMTATSSEPEMVGCGHVAVMLVCELTAAEFICLRASGAAVTVTVAEALSMLHVFVTRTQYERVAVSSGVVNEL